MDASTLATRPSADPCLVHFDMLAGPTTDPVLVGPHHGRAELVENAKGGLVAREPELALELHGGHAGRLAGDEVSGPEPYAQRRMLRSMTVPAVNPVWRRHLRYVMTPGRVAMRNGSPTSRQ